MSKRIEVSLADNTFDFEGTVWGISENGILTILNSATRVATFIKWDGVYFLD